MSSSFPYPALGITSAEPPTLKSEQEQSSDAAFLAAGKTPAEIAEAAAFVRIHPEPDPAALQAQAAKIMPLIFSLLGSLPEIEWGPLPWRTPLSEAPISLTFFNSGYIRASLNLEGVAPDRPQDLFFALERRQELLGKPLVDAIRKDFEDPDRKRLRECVVALREEVQDAEATIAAREQAIRAELEQAKAHKQQILDNPCPGMTLAIDALEENIAALEARLGRLNFALDAVRDSYKAAREQLKLRIAESAQWHAPAVRSRLLLLREIALRTAYQLGAKLLTLAASVESTRRGCVTEDVILKFAEPLLEQLSRRDPPEPPSGTEAEPAATVVALAPEPVAETVEPAVPVPISIIEVEPVPIASPVAEETVPISIIEVEPPEPPAVVPLPEPVPEVPQEPAPVLPAAQTPPPKPKHLCGPLL